MRRLHLLAAAVVLPAVLVGTAACTGSDDGSEVAGSPSVPDAPVEPPPDLAGTAEAQAVASLPDGSASGTAVLAYSGVGEVREPFSGACSRAEGGTRIDGSADTAHIQLDIVPEGAELVLEDIGFSATSSLTTGRYDVTGNHLSLSAELAQDGQTVGSIELEIDCGG